MSELIYDHALKYSMKKVLLELGNIHQYNKSLPDSWACIHVLQEFKQSFGLKKVDKTELCLVRKLLLNTALQNPDIFRKANQLDYAVLVVLLSCLIASQLYQRGNVDANQRMLESLLPEWSENVWKKSCRTYHFKENLSADQESYKKIYNKQRSLLLNLGESIARQKKIVETFSSSLVIQINKVFPPLLQYMESIRPSALEKILNSKENPTAAEHKLVANKLRGEKLTEELLLAVLEEISTYQLKQSFLKAQELMFEQADDNPEDASPIPCLFVASRDESLVPFYLGSKDMMVKRIRTAKDFPGTNAAFVKSEKTDSLVQLDMMDAVHENPVEDLKHVCQGGAAALQSTTDITTETLLQVLEENVNKLQDAGRKEKVRALLRAIKEKIAQE